MALTDGKATDIVRFLDVIQAMLNNVADVIPHCTVQGQGCYYASYFIYTPASPSSLKGSLGHGYSLDSTTGPITCQVQPGPAHSLNTPLSRQKLQEGCMLKAQAGGKAIV